MSSFVPGNIRTAVIANADILHNCIVMDGLVLRIVMDSLILRVVMDGLGITPEELIAAMRKEAEVREKSNGERAENDE